MAKAIPGNPAPVPTSIILNGFEVSLLSGHVFSIASMIDSESAT